MQSVSVYKPTQEREYRREELNSFSTRRIESINGNEEHLNFQLEFLDFNEEIGGYVRCHISMEEAYNIVGRVGNQEIQHVIISSTFESFLNTANGTFVVLGNKKSAEVIDQQFHQHFKTESEKYRFNLENIIQEASNVKKTQFRRLTMETLHGSSLTGNRVTDTGIYRLMLSNGELSNISVIYPYETHEVSFSISDMGSIVFFSSMSSEEIVQFIECLIVEMEI